MTKTLSKLCLLSLAAGLVACGAEPVPVTVRLVNNTGGLRSVNLTLEGEGMERVRESATAAPGTDPEIFSADVPAWTRVTFWAVEPSTGAASSATFHATGEPWTCTATALVEDGAPTLATECRQ